MTHIERRARIIRKARRIVILLLIGVTIAIALIDITEEQEPTNTTNNVSTGHESPQDIPQRNNEVVVKKEKVTTENEDKRAPEQKAKKTLEFDNSDNKKQVVSSEIGDKNERKDAVVKVEDKQEQVVDQVVADKTPEITNKETSEQKQQSQTVATQETPTTPEETEVVEKTVENYRDVKEYDEKPQVVETPKQKENTTKPPVLREEINENRFVEETLEEQNAAENTQAQEAIVETTPKESERLDIAYKQELDAVYKQENTSTQAKTLIDPKASEYIVQPNDTISHIALYYYGKGKSYYWKYIANYNKISQEKRLKIKQHLYIPTLEFIEKHYVVKKPIQKLHKKTSEYVYYTVEKGDSLDKIAEDNETTYNNILDCNNWLKRNPKIKVGMILRVPKGKKLVGK